MHRDRRAFTASMLMAAAGTMIASAFGAQTKPKVARANNVVLVHGLFADGSSWSEVIPLLQTQGLNVTSVQNPLTTLEESVAACRKVLDRQNGATVLAGHSFSGMLVTEAGVHPNVSALVYVAARAPDVAEDYAALASRFPAPPASAGIVFDGDDGRLTEEAFLKDFAGDLPPAKARALFAVQQPFRKACSPAERRRPHGVPSPVSMPYRQKIERSIRICSAMWPHACQRERWRSSRVMYR